MTEWTPINKVVLTSDERDDGTGDSDTSRSDVTIFRDGAIHENVEKSLGLSLSTRPHNVEFTTSVDNERYRTVTGRSIDEQVLEQTFRALDRILDQNPAWSAVINVTLVDIGTAFLDGMLGESTSLASILNCVKMVHTEDYEPSEVEIEVLREITRIVSSSKPTEDAQDEKRRVCLLVGSIWAAIRTFQLRLEALRQEAMGLKIDTANITPLRLETLGAKSRAFDSVDSTVDSSSGEFDNLSRAHGKQTTEFKNRTYITTGVNAMSVNGPMLKLDQAHKAKLYTTRLPKTATTNLGTSASNVHKEIRNSEVSPDGEIGESVARSTQGKGNFGHARGVEWEPREQLSMLERMRAFSAQTPKGLDPEKREQFVHEHNKAFSGQFNSKGQALGKRGWDSIRQQRAKLTDMSDNSLKAAIDELRDKMTHTLQNLPVKSPTKKSHGQARNSMGGKRKVSSGNLDLDLSEVKYEQQKKKLKTATEPLRSSWNGNRSTEEKQR